MDWTNGSSLPKLLMTLFDVWVLKAPNLDKVPNIASWVPIDHQPVPPDVAKWCMKPNVMPIAMSKFGKAELDKAGVRSLYVPHAIDAMYHPTKTIRDNANQTLSGRKIMGFNDD